MQKRVLIAVADSPFPDLEPARAVLQDLNPEIVLAPEPTAEAIATLASRADAVMVTYAKLTA